jgi:hypothetical protein
LLPSPSLKFLPRHIFWSPHSMMSLSSSPSSLLMTCPHFLCNVYFFWSLHSSSHPSAISLFIKQKDLLKPEVKDELAQITKQTLEQLWQGLGLENGARRRPKQKTMKGFNIQNMISIKNVKTPLQKRINWQRWEWCYSMRAARINTYRTVGKT